MSESYKRRKLGDILLDAGVITQKQLDVALNLQAQAKVSGHPLRLGDVLVNENYTTDDAIKSALCSQLSISFLPSIDIEKIDSAVTKYVLPSRARQWSVLPIKIDGNVLTLAIEDPLNYDAKEFIDAQMRDRGIVTKYVIPPKDDLAIAIATVYSKSQLEEALQLAEIQMKPLARQDSDVLTANEPAQRLVRAILEYAITERASDIHLKPCYEDRAVASFRVDGIMRDGIEIPAYIYRSVRAILKNLSGMIPYENFHPQDGRMQREFDGRYVDFRVSTLPAKHNNESIVIRVLDKLNSITTLEQIGFLPRLYEQYKDSVNSSSGLILVTGPTGSGKTTTLYASLGAVNNGEQAINTIEDPIEYDVPGITQTQIDLKRTPPFTYQDALRTLMRQDPDVILIGEIRDPATADMVMQSALTGHKVFSTLHTTDAASAIVRLGQMGAEDYLISSCVSAVLAQRLVRKVCDHCKVAIDPDPYMMQAFNTISNMPPDIKIYKGTGCDVCRKTGYSGRIAIAEILTMGDYAKEAILSGMDKDSISITNLARQNVRMNTMMEYGLIQVIAGNTTPDEVRRVAYNTQSKNLTKKSIEDVFKDAGLDYGNYRK